MGTHFLYASRLALVVMCGFASLHRWLNAMYCDFPSVPAGSTSLTSLGDALDPTSRILSGKACQGRGQQCSLKLLRLAAAWPYHFADQTPAMGVVLITIVHKADGGFQSLLRRGLGVNNASENRAS